MVCKSSFLTASLFIIGFVQTAAGQAPGTRPAGGGAPQTPPLLMTVDGFADGATIPDKFTCSAQPAPVSPAVHWSQVPVGTQSFLLLLHDPEPHHGGHLEDVTHWLIYNIPGSATGLPEGVPAGTSLPDGSRQVGAMGRAGFRGPCAPPGPQHHYTWELLALDTMLTVSATATRAEIIQAADGHILGGAEWIGRYARPVVATPAR